MKALPSHIAQQCAISLLPALQAFGRRDGLRAFPVIGDMMAPTFRRGDFALVAPVDDWRGAGVYVIGLEDPSLLRVEVAVRGRGAPARLRLVPDNRLYSADEVTLAWFRAHVVAKAAFAVTMMDPALIPDELRL